MANSMTSLESALTRLDRMVGIGAASSTKVTATHVRAHTVRGGSNLLAEIAAPLARSATGSVLSDLGDSGDGNAAGNTASSSGGFNLSSGQSMADIASAIARANKRYL